LKIKTSLTTRAFAFSFLPVCAVLATSFVAINALVQQRVKQGLRDSLEKSEELLARADDDYSRQTNQFLGILAESAGLKAAICCMRLPQVRKTPPRFAVPSKRNCARCTN